VTIVSELTGKLNRNPTDGSVPIAPAAYFPPRISQALIPGRLFPVAYYRIRRKRSIAQALAHRIVDHGWVIRTVVSIEFALSRGPKNPVIVGPVFYRELATAPRRPKLFIYRAAYAAGFLILMSTAWAVLTGAQIIGSVGDMARFGLILFDLLAPLQLAIVMFYAAISCSAAVAQEKDRRTLLLLLLTRLSNSELVLGKLMASMLHVFVLIAAALPIFMLVVLFGGVSFAQVVRVLAVTIVAALVAGSLGNVIAFWRDKTFQTLALVALTLFLWMGFWEVVHAGVLGTHWLGVTTERIATAFDPWRAIRLASRPSFGMSFGLSSRGGAAWSGLFGGVGPYLACGCAMSVLLSATAIWYVRIWNPSRQLRRIASETGSMETIWSADAKGAALAEAARAGHVDATLRASTARHTSRQVWDNPVLWREVCTWAYGRKVMIVRLVYIAIVAMVVVGLNYAGSALGGQTTAAGGTVIPVAAKLLVPLFLLSLVIVNATAVTSVTTERDGRSLDLLLASDLSPHEFVFGKLGGVFSVAGLMVVAPMALSVYVWLQGGLSFENLIFVLGGLGVMNVFVATLGLHSGTRYANSRTAIGVSLGAVFFLFLGVVACLMMMVSFSGSFQVQLAPFLAFILGGGVGFYAALGAGNPSKAIAAASMLVPFATFYSITSFLLRHNLAAFLVTVTAYGFATAAMLIPALYEFDFAMGRTSTAEE
jgi:ABC-type Na+ efflux pump permease subunit